MDKVAEEALQELLNGHDVIIRFQRKVDLDRVESRINLCVGDYGLNVVIRHMELK